jgi:Uma2 family endonuclease
MVRHAHNADLAPETTSVFMSQTAARWTLPDLDRLPEDGNRHEIVDGELFVTPPPSSGHEDVLAVLSALLQPYVARHRLGRVYHPRAVVEAGGSRVEPDLMVRPLSAIRPATWAAAAVPILVVEHASASTMRRDHIEKRGFYLRNGVPTYWILDAATRSVRVVMAGKPDEVAERELTWHPAGASEPLIIDVHELYREALAG